jgi:glycosyltransferase involved in cell wall biosynthesis
MSNQQNASDGRAGPSAPTRTVLFASAHSLVDFSNGASVATRDLLQRLAASGFEAHAFCTPKRDLPREVGFARALGDWHEPSAVRGPACGSHPARILSTRRGDVSISIIGLDSTRHGPPQPEEVLTVLNAFRSHLDALQPDVMLTYGGDPITQGMIALARRSGIPIVFALHNLAYTAVQPFANVDEAIVPSQFAQRHYRDRLGLDCHVLPNPVDWDRVRVERRDPRFVTFVNPVQEKGVCPFVRIAQELGRRRPEIPFLVVESRGNRRNLTACGLGRDAPVSVQLMSHTHDPRRFYALTRMALMPSLCPENQPLVAIESLINGIPVLGSDRGGIPEVLGDCGFVLPLPERLTPESTVVPDADEVEPWVETIIRLWDDRAWYEEQGARARREAQRWHPDRLRPLYAEFFRNVRVQPGPPLVVGDGRPRTGAERPSPVPIDASTVTAALWRGVPESARQVLEIRWADLGPGSIPSPTPETRGRPPGPSPAIRAQRPLTVRWFARIDEPGRKDRSPWRRLGVRRLDVEDVLLTLAGAAGFDAILLDQVLEDLPDPAAWLRRLQDRLAPAGVVIAAAGDVAYYARLGVFPGGFSAAEPPRRLFSTETLNQLFRAAGLDAELIGTVAAPCPSERREPSPSSAAADPPAPAPGRHAFLVVLSHFIVRAGQAAQRATLTPHPAPAPARRLSPDRIE